MEVWSEPRDITVAKLISISAGIDVLLSRIAFGTEDARVICASLYPLVVVRTELTKRLECPLTLECVNGLARMADPFMEARAMMLLEFGCPPLPIANGKRSDGTPVVINSHDLLCTFMAQAFKQQDGVLNQGRKENQLRIYSEYRGNILARKDDACLYEIMSNYTRDYMATYLLPPYRKQDIVMLPRDHISPFLFDEIRQYHAALCLVNNHKNKSDGGDGDASRLVNLDSLLQGVALQIIEPAL